jgi:hypothetical protein
MANEGIMALPEGMPMQGEAPVNERPSVTSADSYDAAQIALGMVNPGAEVAMKEAIRQNIGDLQLTPEQLDLMIQVFEYVSQNPVEYTNMVKLMQDEGVIDPGDMPEEYDPVFLGTMLAVLNEMQQMQGEGAQEPMGMSPMVEGMQPMAFAQGGLADVGQYLASKGRGGDRILAHITPEEAEMLRSRGGAGTINPITGLPEFKGNPLKKLFKGIEKLVKSVVKVVKKVVASPIGKILSTVALATVLGPAGMGMSMGTAAGVASAGTTALGGGSLKDSLISGALGYVGGGGTVMGTSPTSLIGQYLPGAAGGALNTGLATGVLGAGIGKLGGMSTADALKLGLTSGASAAAMQGLQGTQGQQADASGTQAQPAAPAENPLAPAQYDGTARSMLSMQPNQAMSYTAAPATAPATSSPNFFERMMGSSSSPTPTVAAAATPAASSPGFFDSLFGSSAPSGTAAATLGAAAPGAATTAAKLAATASGMSLPTKIALGLGVAGMAGGFQNQETPLDPVTEAEKARYMEDARIANERDRFIREGGYGLETARITPYNPIVSTDYSAAVPIQMGASATMPGGITRAPTGVAQPYNLAGTYGVPLVYGQNAALAAPYAPGVQGLAKGGAPVPTQFPRKTGPINGPGSGTSDDIPAMLSDGEFVFTAKAVRNAGNGSRRKGAARMYKLMKMLEGGPVKGK